MLKTCLFLLVPQSDLTDCQCCGLWFGRRLLSGLNYRLEIVLEGSTICLPSVCANENAVYLPLIHSTLGHGKKLAKVLSCFGGWSLACPYELMLMSVWNIRSHRAAP